MNFLRRPQDHLVINVAALVFVTFLQSLQILVWAAVALSFIPIPATSFSQKIFPVYLPEVLPEREMFLFHLFVGAAIVVQAAWIVVWHRHLSEPGLWQKFRIYSAATAFLLFLQLFAVFKIFVWGDPGWARVLLCGSAVLAIAMQVFWPEVGKIYRQALAWWGEARRAPSWVWDLGFVIMLVLLLWPSNVEYVLGRMLLRDQFYHLDSLVMAPGWAHHNGLVLDQDISSQYSVGVPIVISTLLQHTLGFDYPAVVALVMGVCLAYYAGLYFFIRHWLGNRVLAAAGVLLAIKWQMFHWGVAPLVWQFPSATPLRHWPDVLFFACVWQHMRTGRGQWFWGAALATGFMFYWMVDVGVYLLAALLAYAAVFSFWQRLKPAPALALMLGGAAIAAGFLLALDFVSVQGAVFKPEFWQSQFEFSALFLQGWGALPVTDGLQDKQFLAFVMGFVIPVVYVLTLLYVGGRIFLRTASFESALVLIVCTYGLGLYHYFIHRSGVTSYYAVCIPLVLVLCFWGRTLLQWRPAWRRPSICLVPIMLGALMASYFFTYYPNVFNLGGLDWNKEQQNYRQAFDFKVDAALIAARTGPKERVALISSFETRILMQANRPPFFYYFPLVESSLPGADKIRSTYIHTQRRLKAVMAQLRTTPPAYIFVEERLGRQGAGQAGLEALLAYVQANYQEEAKGQHLMAYKRKD